MRMEEGQAIPAEPWRVVVLSVFVDGGECTRERTIEKNIILSRGFRPFDHTKRQKGSPSRPGWGEEVTLGTA